MSSEQRSLKVSLKECIGCRACTLACAVAHEGQVEFQRARIRVEKRFPDLETPVYKPLFCRMCRNAKCVAVCSTGALIEDKETKLVVLDVELCSGCGNCVAACPFDAIWLDETRNFAVKCDLCDGSPACVAACAPGALRFD